MAALLVAIACALPPAVFVGGQSLSYAPTASPALSETQELGNLVPSGTVVDATTKQVQTSDKTLWPLTDLVESGTESPRSGLGNFYATETGQEVVVYGVGRGSAAWVTLAPGTDAWTWTASALESYGARGGTGVLGLYVAHGEGDHRDGTTRAAYAAILGDWQEAFHARAVGVGFPAAVHPLYFDQLSNWQMFPAGSGSPTATVVLGQYDAARANPGALILIGPKYQWTTTDGVHLNSSSSRALGAMAAKVIAQGPTWEPLWPSREDPITRDGAVITIPMHVPVPPLVIDDTSVTDPGDYGFEYDDDGTPPAISSVAVDGTNIIITLESTPSGANKKIRYALATTSNTWAGPTTGPRGCVRDSDSAEWEGTHLYNRAVHFEEDVP